MAELLLLLLQKVDMMVAFRKVNIEYGHLLPNVVFPNNILPCVFVYTHLKMLNYTIKKIAEHWKM